MTMANLDEVPPNETVLTDQEFASPLRDGGLPLIHTKVPKSPSIMAPTLPASPAGAPPSLRKTEGCADEVGLFNSAAGKIETTYSACHPYFGGSAAALLEPSGDGASDSGSVVDEHEGLDQSGVDLRVEALVSEEINPPLKPLAELTLGETSASFGGLTITECASREPVSTGTAAPSVESPWNELDDNSFLVGYSPKGTTFCGLCGQRVAKGKLQVGIFYAHKHKFSLLKWHHMHCILPPACIASPMDLCGIEDVRGEDMDTVLRWLGYGPDGNKDRAWTM
ncbi:unnamed protein product [Discosporangium mesarthrocarpum]